MGVAEESQDSCNRNSNRSDQTGGNLAPMEVISLPSKNATALFIHEKYDAHLHYESGGISVCLY